VACPVLCSDVYVDFLCGLRTAHRTFPTVWDSGLGSIPVNVVTLTGTALLSGFRLAVR
jgi:hypothetical protein